MRPGLRFLLDTVPLPVKADRLLRSAAGLCGERGADVRRSGVDLGPDVLTIQENARNLASSVVRSPVLGRPRWRRVRLMSSTFILVRFDSIDGPRPSGDGTNLSNPLAR